MYIQLNGQVIYYEKTGTGSPVIFVHGNGETHEILKVAAGALSGEHTVYLLDSRGHGKSGTVTEYHYRDMAEDIAAFVAALDLVRPAFYGHSDGGIIGLIAAAKHPTLFSSMVISGANLTPRGLKPAVRLKIRLKAGKTKNPLFTLMLKEPRLTKQELSRISIPVLVLAGSKDIIKQKETRRIAAWLLDSTLKILPGETHSSYVRNSPKLGPILLDFYHS